MTDEHFVGGKLMRHVDKGLLDNFLDLTNVCYAICWMFVRYEGSGWLGAVFFLRRTSIVLKY